MKKYFLSIFLVLSFSAFAISQRFGSSEAILPQNNSVVGIESVVVPISGGNSAQGKQLVAIVKRKTQTPVVASKPVVLTPTPISIPTRPMMPISNPSPMMKPKGIYTDGTYNGDVVSEYYGDIQVAVVIQNGKLVDVLFLQYPTDRNTSAQINQQALPMLKSEAIQAQSANIDSISGASETSAGFIPSLASALVKAKN